MSQSKNWKFGVFSLIALMVTIGLFAGSALAAISANTPAGRIPAGSGGNTITLNLSGIDTAKGPITIDPPDGWSTMQIIANSTEGFTTGVTLTDANDPVNLQPGGSDVPAGGIAIKDTVSSITVIYGDTTASINGGAVATRIITSSGVFTIKQFNADGTFTPNAGNDTTVSIITGAEGSGAMTPLAQNVLGGKSGVSFTFNYQAVGNKPTGTPGTDFVAGENDNALNGGTFEIDIPAGWSDPNGRIVLETPDPDGTAANQPADAASVSLSPITGSGPWTVSVTINDMDGGDTLKVKYNNVTVPIVTGNTPYTFTTRVAPFGRTPRQLASGSPVVTATTAGKGSGTISVVTGNRLAANSEGNTIVFRYTSAGTLSGGALVIKRPSAEWTKPQGAPGAAGATSISFPNGGSGPPPGFAQDDNNGFVADDINITIGSLTIGQVIEITYANVKAPQTLGTHIFKTFVTPDRPIDTVTDGPDADIKIDTQIDPSPDVTVQAGDGTGNIGVVVVRNAGTADERKSNAGEGEKIEFTFTAIGTMDGGEISLTIDSDWPIPTSGNTAVTSTGSTGTPVFISRTITVPIVALANTQKITIKYGKDDNNKVAAPPVPETSTFLFKSKGTPGGVLTQVGNPLEIEVRQAKDGSGSAAISFVSGTMPGIITAGGTNNQVTIVYTAVGKMDGGKLRLNRPTGWTDFKEADGTIHVTVESTGNFGTVAVVADKVTVDLTNLAATQTVTFRYTGAKAQTNAQDNVRFKVESQGSSGGGLLEISPTDPKLNVKNAADSSGTATIAIEGNAQGASTSAQATTSQTFRLVYKGIGTMNGGRISVTVPSNFALLTSVNAAPANDGEIQVIPGTNPAVTIGTLEIFGRTITVPITTLPADGQIDFLYKTNVGTTKGDSTFTVKSQGSNESGRSLVTLTTTLPKVTVTNVPDGTGTAKITQPAADANDGDKRKLSVKAENQTIKFVFEAAGPMDGGAVELTVTDNRWSKPGGQIGANVSTEPGFIQVIPSGGGQIGPLSFGGPNVFTVTIPITNLVKPETLTIEYRNVTVPSAAETYNFTIKSKGSSGGTLQPIADNNTVKLQIVAQSLEGSGNILVSPKIIVRGEKRNYIFTYTALGSIERLNIQVPANWTPTPQKTNSTADGFVTTTKGTLTPTGSLIKLTDLGLKAGEQVIITYNNVIAPDQSGPNVGDFIVSSSALTDGSGVDPTAIPGTPGAVFVTAKVSLTADSGKVVAAEGEATTPDTQLGGNVQLNNDLGGPVRAAGKTRLRFVYKADGFIKDGELEIQVPGLWTPPTTSDARGKVTVSRNPDPDNTNDPSIVSTSGGSIIVAIPRLEANQTVTVLYGSGTDKEAFAPSTSGNSPFRVFIKSNPSGTRQSILKNEFVAGNGQVLVDVKSAASGTGSFAYQGPSAVNGGSKNNRFIFTYTAAGTMNSGSIKVTIPNANTTDPLKVWSAPTTAEVRGKVAVTISSGGAIGTVDPTGNAITVPITTLGPGGTIQITYGSGTDREPVVQGRKEDNVFFLTESKGSEGTDSFAAVGPAADGKIKLNVLQAADGSGNVAITAPTTPSFAAASGGNQITFTYTAVGQMSGGEIRLFPASGWSVPQGQPTGAGYTTATAGIGPPKIGTLTFDGSSVTVPIVTMVANDTIVIQYGDLGGGAGSGAVAANVATATDASKFTVQSRASGGSFVQVVQPGVTVTNVNNGSGRASVVNIDSGRPNASDSSVTAGVTDNTLEFTYTAVGTMNGGAIRMTVPAGWTAPTVGSGGNTSVSSSGTIGTVELDGGRVRVPITTFGAGGTITIRYKGNAQTTKDTTDPKPEFLFGSAGDSTLTFIDINTGASASGSSASPQIAVTEAADSSGIANVDIKVVKKGEKRTYVFTYTAIGEMTTGGEIRVVVPDDWTAPRTDPGDGQFSIAESSAATITAALSGREMRAKIDAGSLLANETVTFNYTNAVAPNTSNVYPFVVKSQGTADGRSLQAIGTSPAVTTTKIGDGSGAVSVTNATVRAASTNNHTFTYTAVEGINGGELRITTPAGWTKAKDGILVGNVAITGGNLGNISYADFDTTIVIGIANLGAQGQITANYNNATAQTAAGVATFVTQTKLTQGGTPTSLDAPATVTVDKVNDGTGRAVYVGNPVNAASTGNELTFEFTPAGTMDTGEISLTVPAGWTAPQGTQFQPGYTIPTTPSGGSVGSLTFSGQIVTVPINTLGPGQIVRIIYGSGSGSSGVQAQSTAGGATFIVKSKGKSGGTLKSISDAPNNAVHPVVVVKNARDGSGTMTVSPPSVSAGSSATLTFTYAPAGTVDGGAISITVPQGWPNPTSSNTIVQPEPGALFGTLQFSGGIVTVPIIALTSGQTVRVQYTVTVPSVLSPPPATFAAKSQGLPTSQGGVLVELDAGSPSVTVTGARDGSGTANVTSTAPVAAGSSGNEIRIVYATAGSIQNGAVSVDIPAGWTPRDGTIAVSSTGAFGTATFANGVVTVPITNLSANQTVTITYSNATAQGNAGNAVFVVKSQGSAAGQLAQVTQGSFTLTVGNAADGSGTATISPTSVVAGGTVNLELRYTAVGSMDGGRIVVNIPGGWTVGAVTSSSVGGSIDQPTVSGSQISVRINSLAAGQTVVISLNNATVPSVLGAAPFTVQSRGSASGTSTNLTAGSLSVNVTVAASALAILGAPQTIFKGVASGPITIETRDAAGNPATSASGVTVTLSSSSSTGAFDTAATGAFNGTVTSVTIAAGATSATVFYKDPTAGTATLTATVASFPEATRTATQSITMSEPPTALAIISAGTVFEGDALQVTIETRDAAGNRAASESAVTVNLLSSSSTGTFNPATVTIAAGATSATVTYRDTIAGTATLTASATGFTSGTDPVTVTSGVTSVTVSGSPVKADGTITVTAIGKPGATASFSIGNIVTDKGLTESAAGTYTGTFTPVVDVHADGIYDVVVKIGSSSLTKTGAVVIDNAAPKLTVPALATTTIKNGQTLTLSVKSDSGLMVWAVGVSALDSTKPDRVDFVESQTEAGTYSASIPISEENTADNGLKTLTIKAKDAAGNTAEAPVTVDLRNGAEFELSVPKDISLIHIPLQVTAVGDQTMTLKTVSDLYDALGGSANVNFIITRDTSAGVWRSYLGAQSKGTSADKAFTDDLGLITVMKNAVTLHLKGDALGTDGKSQITLKRGTNLVGVPLKNANLQRVSDLLSLTGIKDNATTIIVSDAGTFKVVAQPGDDGDINLTGGQSFIITARADGVAEVTGEAWDNVSGSASAAPPMALVGLRVDTQTPVLEVHGAVVDEVKGVAKDGFRVIVKNLSTGASLNTHSGSETSDGHYSITFVESSRRAAQVGDILEISVDTQNPLIGVQPLRHIVTTDDVKASQIQLENLIAYEVPKETKLLPNYPNPFNPETWVPYRLAKDSSVTLTIYDTMGRLVRTIQVGHKPAALYESRDKAIYWDGRNDYGERVASGIYFYNLTVKDFTATRKMVILK